MGLFEIIFIALGLAMDAFAVSICKGLSMKKMDVKKALIIGLYFGAFQAGMPVIGYFLGTSFSAWVEKIDHWIAFWLLLILGIKMIIESRKEENDSKNDKVDFKTMLLLSVATSIDALTVGITFAFLKANIFLSAGIIGVITFALSAVGVKIGNKFGDKFQNKAEVAGGIVLILIGAKILLEHLGLI